MPRDAIPGSAEDWLLRAKGKLAAARQPLPEGAYWEDWGFMAQQAAELAIKSVYQHFGWTFPFIHDLARLITILADKNIRIPDQVRAASKLTVYATELRYPGLKESTTEAEYRNLLEIAETVVNWTEAEVGSRKRVSGQG